MRLPSPITSRTNARVKALRAAFGGRASAPGDLTAIEGEHLLSEAVEAGLPLQTVFVGEGSEGQLHRPWARNLRDTELVLLSRDVFDSAVDTATPQGIAATFVIPSAQRPAPNARGVVLLLENIQDPGNVGTLVRSAAAFGAAEVLLVGECANPWSPKVVRASAGAVFRIAVTRMELAEVSTSLRAARRLLAAVPASNGAVLSVEAQLGEAAILIGNEGRGLSAKILAAAHERVTIPCQVESFNAAVAGSLLLYEAYRQGVRAATVTPQDGTVAGPTGEHA